MNGKAFTGFSIYSFTSFLQNEKTFTLKCAFSYFYVLIQSFWYFCTYLLGYAIVYVNKICTYYLKEYQFWSTSSILANEFSN